VEAAEKSGSTGCPRGTARSGGASTGVDGAEAAFDATMEKIFGLLVAHFESRAVAGSYFPA
jgi:hypothetical protein